MNEASSSQGIIFQNPECKPLENLNLMIKNNGVLQTIPALDRYWVEKKYFLNYESPNLVDSDGRDIIGAKERWIELACFILDDLIWLLRLPFHKFWSNIIYNPSIMNSFIIFLQEAPIFYTSKNFPDDYDVKEYFHRIRQNILLVLARLITNKETPEEYISLAEYAHLLHSKYIFTIPIIMDLCQQYGRDNRKIVEKIVNSVFTIQPQYKQDLEIAVTFIIQALRNIERRFEDCPINQEGKAVPLSDRGGANIEMNLLSLEDMILYLLDTVSTINIFINIYQSAVNNFKTEHFITKIISIYGNTIPDMYTKLNNLGFKDETIAKYVELKLLLDVTRIEILNTYRTIIYTNIRNLKESEKNSISSSELEEMVEDFLNSLMYILSEKDFVIDYNNLYPVTEDMQTLIELYPDLDSVKCDFIVSSIFTFIDESTAPSTSISKIKISKPSVKSNNIQNKVLEVDNKINKPGTSKIENTSEIKLSSLITEVKDIFCDLGEGFIEMCLKHYNCNAEAVINAILEDSLPVELKNIDRSLPLIPPDTQEASALVDAAIGIQRLNVYDNDEFDIMTRDDIDTSKIHKGKRKDKYKNMNDFLNDKSHISQTKDLYSKYSIVTSEYDDEYDDTYDDHDVGSSAQDDIIEVDGRPFTVPRVLQKRGASNFEEIYEEDDLNETAEASLNKNDFAQDPALLRARAEERYLSKRGGKSFNTHNRNVVGNAKGQGQTKDVLDNRNQKNRNKATKANHNRRAGSQWKRSHGMVPS